MNEIIEEKPPRRADLKTRLCNSLLKLDSLTWGERLLIHDLNKKTEPNPPNDARALYDFFQKQDPKTYSNLQECFNKIIQNPEFQSDFLKLDYLSKDFAFNDKNDVSDFLSDYSGMSWLQDHEEILGRGVDPININEEYIKYIDPDYWFQPEKDLPENLECQYDAENVNSQTVARKINLEQSKRDLFISEAVNSLEVSTIFGIQSWILEKKGFLVGDLQIEKAFKILNIIKKSPEEKKELIIEFFKNFPNLTFDELALKIKTEKSILISLYDIAEVKEVIDIPEKWKDLEGQWQKMDLKKITDEDWETKKVERTWQLFKELGRSDRRIEKTLRSEGFWFSANFIKNTLKAKGVDIENTKNKYDACQYTDEDTQEILRLFDAGKKAPEIIKETEFLKSKVYRVINKERPGELETKVQKAAKEKDKKEKLVIELHEANLSNKKIECELRKKGFTVTATFVSNTLKANGKEVSKSTRDKYPKEAKEKVIKLYRSYFQIERIAEKTGIAKRTVKRYVEEYRRQKEEGEKADYWVFREEASNENGKPKLKKKSKKIKKIEK